MVKETSDHLTAYGWGDRSLLAVPEVRNSDAILYNVEP